MGSGRLSDKDLDIVMDKIVIVPGDFAEIGVYMGALFYRLCHIAQPTNIIVHGYDSFCGMAKPTKDDNGYYPEGKLSVGGVESFIKILDEYGVRKDVYCLHPGYVPDCFRGSNPNLSFVYIDLDHYEPTVTSIFWVLGHLAPGAVIGFDDYFPGRNYLASKAVDEFIKSGVCEIVHETDNNEVFVRMKE